MNFPIQRNEGSVRAANGALLGCKESSRAAFRNLCQIGYSVCFPLPHLPSVPFTLREKRYRKKKSPGVRSRKASNQREKLVQLWHTNLKTEKKRCSTRAVFTNSPCSGTERVSANAFAGMPPFYAHIRKDGANFAQIDCYSNGDDFSVVPMHPLF